MPKVKTIEHTSSTKIGEIKSIFDEDGLIIHFVGGQRVKRIKEKGTRQVRSEKKSHPRKKKMTESVESLNAMDLPQDRDVMMIFTQQF